MCPNLTRGSCLFRLKVLFLDFPPQWSYSEHFQGRQFIAFSVILWLLFFEWQFVFPMFWPISLLSPQYTQSSKSFDDEKLRQKNSHKPSFKIAFKNSKIVLFNLSKYLTNLIILFTSFTVKITGKNERPFNLLRSFSRSMLKVEIKYRNIDRVMK